MKHLALRLGRLVAASRGLREMTLTVVVVIAAPVAVTWAREALTSEPVVVPPVALTELGEPEALHRRYGLSIVAMPDPPNHTAMADVHAASGEIISAPLAYGVAPGLAPASEFACPEVRAIVSGDDAFAIIAWDDSSYVAKLGHALTTPMGEVTLQRLRPRSLTLIHGDITLQCHLKR